MAKIGVRGLQAQRIILALPAAHHLFAVHVVQRVTDRFVAIGPEMRERPKALFREDESMILELAEVAMWRSAEPIQPTDGARTSRAFP